MATLQSQDIGVPNGGYCKTTAKAAQTVEPYWDGMKAQANEQKESPAQGLPG